MKIDDIMTLRATSALLASEFAHATSCTLRRLGEPWLRCRVMAVVAHDRALREVDRQPVRQEASK